MPITPFSYKKLWSLLAERGMTREKLRVDAKLSPNTISAMGRGEVISGKMLERICEVLSVTPDEIMEIKSEK